MSLLSVDPIRFEVIRNAMLAVVEEMGAALKRSAYSTNIKTRADFSCGFFDQKCRIVVQAFAQPTHLASLVEVVPNTVKDYGVENLSPGDGIIVNDVHRVGGVHLNDIAVVSPVFVGDEVFGYVANIAHHVDVGGGAPGSIAVSTEIYQDGVIIPGVKLIKKGEVDRDLFKFIVANVRGKKESMGDFRAQIAANKLGVRRMHELLGKFGHETVMSVIDEILNYTERRVREELKKFPNGEYHAEGYCDNDGVTDVPIKIKVKLTIRDGDVTIDFTGTDRQRNSPMNCHIGMTRGAIAYIYKCLLPPDVPINDGLYRAINVIAPRGTVLNSTYPVGLVGMAEVGAKALETAFRAFAQALPKRIAAMSKACICNVAFGGVDPRSGEHYVFYETIAGGYGGRFMKDGVDGVQMHWQNTENSPIEELEVNYPVLILRYELIQDSEGAGKYRGGLGIRRDYLFKDHAASFSILSDTAKFPPLGLFGGLPARPLKVIMKPESPDSKELGSKVTVNLESNGVMSVQTPGGGGYGPPLDRDPEMVLKDVRLEKISLRKAREAYGVVIDQNRRGTNDEATAELRSKLKVGASG